jgi:superfamily II DNA or RNA helicase
MILRDYQEKIYNDIKIQLALGKRRILVSAPTGFGKTILAKKIALNANSKGNRVLFTTHRITLADQTLSKFKGMNSELLQGSNKIKNKDSNLIVATLQTLLNSEIKEPKIVIIDEIHYAYKGELIQSLFIKFPDAIFIGLSATPVDNNDNLLDGFDVILDDFQTEDLIKLGYLTPFKCYAPFSVDTSKVKITKNEFNNEELSNTVNKENINNSIVDEFIKIDKNRTFICFAVDLKHCEELKKSFYNQGIKTEIISSSTLKKNRYKYINQLRKKEIQGLISIEILTAGFDEPQVDCVIMATATMQWKKFVQCAGRGIRLLGQNIEESISNGKKDCLFLDFCGNIEKHGMPSERKVFKFGKKISRVIDQELGIDVNSENREEIINTISEEKKVYLKEISSVLDLYDGKVYLKESDLQDDVNTFLKRTNYYGWRQNSGKAFMQGRWIHFASKSGLPDNTVFYKNTSLFFGLELKLPSGRLTSHQKITLPEMTENKILFFIIESVYDVFKAIEHIESNIQFTENGFFISDKLYVLDELQIKRRNKLKIPIY